MATESERINMRFSLRTILISLLVFAIGCALLFSTPSYIAVPALIFLSVALPAGLAAGVVYTRDAWRAFCIGGLFPSGLLLYSTGWLLGLSVLEAPGSIRNISDWTKFSDQIGQLYRFYSGSIWVMIVLIGAMVVLVRYFAHKSA